MALRINMFRNMYPCLLLLCENYEGKTERQVLLTLLMFEHFRCRMTFDPHIEYPCPLYCGCPDQVCNVKIQLVLNCIHDPKPPNPSRSWKPYRAYKALILLWAD